MGMAGGLSLPRPIGRDVIRAEGERLGFEAEALEDFILIVVGFDDAYVEVTVKREAEQASAAVKRANRPKR